MFKNKKLITLMVLVFVSLALVLAGCSSGNNNTAPDGNNNEDEVPLIGFANKSLGYYFFVAQEESLRRTVEERGWKFESTVAEFDSATQFDQFVNMIAKNPKAIISDPIDSEGLIGAVDQAVAAGIPVGIVDTPTTGGDVAITVAFDNYIAGQMAAQEIIKRLEEKYGEPKGTVLNAYGAMDSWAWRLRKEGMDDEFAKYPTINYLAVPAEGDMTLTHDALVNAIAVHGFIDAVHAPSDTPARGLYEALKTNNMLKKVGEEGHVIFVTIDGEPIAHDMIREGYYDATISQDAVSYGEITMELLEKHTFNGEPVPLGTYRNLKYFWEEAEIVESPSGPYVVVPPYVVDSKNVDDARHWGNIAANEWGLKY